MGEVNYFTRERGGVVDWQRNGKFLKEPGYYTTLIGDEAVKLIDQQDGKQPFFLYFASMAPHAPYQVPQEYMDRYPAIQDKQRKAKRCLIPITTLTMVACLTRNRPWARNDELCYPWVGRVIQPALDI